MKEKDILLYTETCAIAPKHEHNPAYGVCPFCYEVYIGENWDFWNEGIKCKCGALLRMGKATLPEEGDKPFYGRYETPVDPKLLSTPEHAIAFMRYAVVRKDIQAIVNVSQAILKAAPHWGKNRGRWFRTGILPSGKKTGKKGTK